MFQEFQLMLHENNRIIPGNYRQHDLAVIKSLEKDAKDRPDRLY
jgi:hypothetical protein